jgi:hypothetical protein
MKRIKILSLVASCATIAGLAVSGLTGIGSSASATGGVRTLHIVTTQTHHAFVDAVPLHKMSAGDQFMFTETLAGDCTGHSAISVTLQADSKSAVFSGYVDCGSAGALTIMASQPFNAPTSTPLVGAITGGTKSYRGARGDFVAHQTKTGANVTVTLLP